MAIKAVCKDKEGIQHLIIGLSRENLNTLVDGEVLTMPQGLAANITEASVSFCCSRRRMRNSKSGCRR
jgi:hypothetical protein